MFLYRLLVSLFALIVLARVVVARDWAASRARLGWHEPDRPGPHIWLHAASNGELASARPVIDALLTTDHGRRILITCNTATGVALAQSWALPRVQARLAPLDIAWVVRRVMRRWQVSGLILMESELWPNRIRLCPGPVVLMGARLTAKSARVWHRFGSLAKTVLAQIDLIAPQDSASRDRLLALGAAQDRMTAPANLKTMVVATAPDLSLAPAFERSNTWMAASTHDGEEVVIAQAHQIARETWPDLHLILAPRHPVRADGVRQILTERGLHVAQRSLGQAPAAADVYLADTMGEMDLWYAQSGVVFVGGSLVDKGGHTPFEPAQFGCALIHGPHVGNFAAAYDALTRAQAAKSIGSAEDLAQALLGLQPPPAQVAAGQRAQAVLEKDPATQVVLDRTVALFS